MEGSGNQGRSKYEHKLRGPIHGEGEGSVNSSRI
jgi:hypothetical protein